MTLQKVLDAFVDKIRRDYADDVSILHVHGSYAYGDTHDLSDLDLYFVPKTPRGENLACTFILDGVGYDFWGISWQRLENIAAHEESTASIITEGRLVYHADDEDLRRFEALRQKALQGRQEGDAAEDAAEKLAPAYQCLYRMRHSTDLAEVRGLAIKAIYTLSFALARLNRRPIARGRKLLKQELLAMPLVPQDFEALYDTAFTAKTPGEIAEAFDRLVGNTARLIEKQREGTAKAIPFGRLFGGFYEEMVQSYNKIYHACQVGDRVTPLFAAAEFEDETRQLFRQAGVAPNLPSMVAAYDPDDLAKIEACAREHQRQFEALLQKHGVPVRRFETFDQFQAFLDAR